MLTVRNTSFLKPARTALYVLAALVISMGFGSCKKYLDKKSDKKLVIPATLKDCQALIDNNFTMNTGYPSNEYYADNFYLTLASYNTQNITRREAYIWQADATTVGEEGVWGGTYQKVLYANQVLATLKTIEPAGVAEQAQWNALKGAALFFRAYSFYCAQQVWGQPYNTGTAASNLGIALKLTESVTEEVSRASVQQTYERILQDLNEALSLLPDKLPNDVIDQTRPNKLAAYAALARVYLTMGDYEKAGINANACLQKYNTLIDFSTLNAAAAYPIAKFNKEMLFYAMGQHGALVSSHAKIDSSLYNSYASGDLRKTVFFRENTGANAGTYFFRGSYDASNSVQQFMGLAVDEVYLIRAECYARANKVTEAMADLNKLLRTRWATGQYTDMTATDATDALTKILRERRKELLFRSLRWTDLRRLNQDTRFATTLTRVLNGQTYTLPPNDPRYAILIPQEVLRRSSMQQNPR